MNDNLFDRLFELLQSPGPVNWKLAREVTGSVAGGREVIEPRLAEEYQELALAAQLHAADTPGITVAAGGLLHPVDRATWAEENEQSFRYLFEPLAERLAGTGGVEGPMGAMLQPLGPALLGMQAGTLIGSMSHEALGQFDAGLPTLDHDRLYLVVPNVESFASDHGLDARQVRLWAATREVVHHAVLETPWLRGHVASHVASYFADLEFDPGGLMEQLGNLQDPEALQSMMSEATSVPSLLGGNPDPAKSDAIAALLVFIEGFGAWATTRALEGLLPDLARITEHARRTEPTQADHALEQLAGISIDRTGVDAAAFTTEVARRWGDEAVAKPWDDPAALPSLAELHDPLGWAARTLL
ncbi:MAG: zinc-dependent metalloprotease [Acidimicrobiia bacterium]